MLENSSCNGVSLPIVCRFMSQSCITELPFGYSIPRFSRCLPCLDNTTLDSCCNSPRAK